MTPHHPRFHTGTPDETGARTTRCETCAEEATSTVARHLDLWREQHRRAAWKAVQAEVAGRPKRTRRTA